MVFTHAEAWLGGFHETAFLFDARVASARVLESIWSFGALEGPYLSRTAEPQDQPRADLGDDEPRYGVLTLRDGARVACATYVLRTDLLEVSFAISVGSLVLAWPRVGAYPFVTHDEAAAWEPELESVLVDCARHVHARTPFLRALVGFEGIGFHDDLRRPGPVPASRGVGILDVHGRDLTWTPQRSAAAVTANGNAVHLTRGARREWNKKVRRSEGRRERSDESRSKATDSRRISWKGGRGAPDRPARAFNG